MRYSNNGDYFFLWLSAACSLQYVNQQLFFTFFSNLFWIENDESLKGRGQTLGQVKVEKVGVEFSPKNVTGRYRCWLIYEQSFKIGLFGYHK